MITLPLSGKAGAGRLFTIDDEAAELVSRFRWHLTTHGYVATSRGPTMLEVAGDGPFIVMLHRFVLGLFGRHDGTDVDHVNMDRLDNRRDNLRTVTRSQNMANGTTRSRCGYRGVVLSDGRWVAGIMVQYKTIYLGRFDDIQAAARAYDDAARHHFGECARLNFPGPNERPARVLEAAR